MADSRQDPNQLFLNGSLKPVNLRVIPGDERTQKQVELHYVSQPEKPNLESWYLYDSIVGTRYRIPDDVTNLRVQIDDGLGLDRSIRDITLPWADHPPGYSIHYFPEFSGLQIEKLKLTCKAGQPCRMVIKTTNESTSKEEFSILTLDSVADEVEFSAMAACDSGTSSQDPIGGIILAAKSGTKISRNDCNSPPAMYANHTKWLIQEHSRCHGEWKQVKLKRHPERKVQPAFVMKFM